MDRWPARRVDRYAAPLRESGRACQPLSYSREPRSRHRSRYWRSLRRQTHERRGAGSSAFGKGRWQTGESSLDPGGEFTWAYFRPAGLIEVKSGISKEGKLTAWEFHNYHSGMSGIETPYDVANQHTEYHQVPLVLRSGSYRGLAATANHFARESHMDALAHVAQMDPFEFRMKNLS